MNCRPAKRKRAAELAAAIRDAMPRAVVVVIDPATPAWSRWTVAVTIPGATAVSPGVAGVIAANGADIRRVRTGGDDAHIVATV